MTGGLPFQMWYSCVTCRNNNWMLWTFSDIMQNGFSQWSGEVSIAKTQNVCFTWYTRVNYRYELHGIFRSGSKSGIWHFLSVRNRNKRPSAQSSRSLKMFIRPSSQYEVTKHGLREILPGVRRPIPPRPPSFWGPHPICVACLCSNQNINKTATMVKLPTILLW